MRRSLFASVAGRYVGMAIQMAASLIVARLLTPAEIGIFGVACAVMVIAATFREFGASSYLIKADELTRATMGRAFGLMLTLSLLTAAAIWFSRGLVAEFFAEPRLAGLIGLMTLTFLLSPFGLVSSAMLQREMAFATLQGITLASTVASVAATIGLAFAGFSFYSLVWGQIASMVTQMVLLAWVRPAGMFVRPRFDAWGDMFRFGVFGTMSSIVGHAGAQSVSIILGRRLGFAPVGYYDRGNGLAGYVNGDLLQSIAQVLYVGLAQVKHNPGQLSWLYLRSMAHVTGVFWPIYIGMALLAEPVVLLLLGPQWGPSASILMILMVGSFLIPPCMLHHRIMLAFGRTDAIFAIEVVLTVVRVAVVFSFAPHGIEAVAWALVVVTGPMTFLSYLIGVRRHLTLPAVALVRELARSAAITACTALPVLLLRSSEHATTARAAMDIAICGTAGGAAWLCAIIAFRHPLVQEIRNLLLRLLGAVSVRQRLS